ncbi:hypothetical protein TNCV_3721681 [Trichonephila clavipes]|nr:hypothetical protein TNCV_3721681 [Trichonephila clavipes]
MYRWPVIVPLSLMMAPHHDTACRISVLFLDIFWTIKAVPLLRQISWRLQSDDRLNLFSTENSTHASSVQSNCDAHDIIANGRYGAVWSMGHTQGLRAYGHPLKRLATVFREINFPEAAETDLPAEL